MGVAFNPFGGVVEVAVCLDVEEAAAIGASGLGGEEGGGGDGAGAAGFVGDGVVAIPGVFVWVLGAGFFGGDGFACLLIVEGAVVGVEVPGIGAEDGEAFGGFVEVALGAGFKLGVGRGGKELVGEVGVVWGRGGGEEAAEGGV